MTRRCCAVVAATALKEVATARGGLLLGFLLQLVFGHVGPLHRKERVASLSGPAWQRAYRVDGCSKRLGNGTLQAIDGLWKLSRHGCCVCGFSVTGPISLQDLLMEHIRYSKGFCNRHVHARGLLHPPGLLCRRNSKVSSGPLDIAWADTMRLEHGAVGVVVHNFGKWPDRNSLSPLTLQLMFSIKFSNRLLLPGKNAEHDRYYGAGARHRQRTGHGRTRPWTRPSTGHDVDETRTTGRDTVCAHHCVCHWTLHAVDASGFLPVRAASCPTVNVTSPEVAAALVLLRSPNMTNSL